MFGLKPATILQTFSSSLVPAEEINIKKSSQTFSVISELNLTGGKQTPETEIYEFISIFKLHNS